MLKRPSRSRTPRTGATDRATGVRDLMTCKLIKSTPWHCPSSIFIATSLDLTYWLPYIYMINNGIKR